MSQTARAHHLQFVKILGDAVLNDGQETVLKISGPDAQTWLRNLWSDAGKATDSDELPSLLRVRTIDTPDYDTYIITIPPAQAPTESYGAIALFHKFRAQEESHFFLLERGDAQDGASTTHSVRLHKDGTREQGDALTGSLRTDPVILEAIARKALGIKKGTQREATNNVMAELHEERRAMFPERKISKRYQIPGWRDSGILDAMLRQEHSGGILISMAVLALVGMVGMGFFAWQEGGHRFTPCIELAQKGYSPAKTCRLVYKKFAGERYDAAKVKARCKTEVEGYKDAKWYCANNAFRIWPLRGGSWVFVMGVLFGLAMLFLFIDFIWRRHVPKFVRMLRHSDKIVWIYIQRTYGGANYSTVFVGMSNGTLLTINPPSGCAENVVENIALMAPGATLGYSEAKLSQFKKNPGAMRI